jgi:hypothetical protein
MATMIITRIIGMQAFPIILSTVQVARSMVRTADPTDRGLLVGSAVRTERRFSNENGPW